MTLLMRLPHKKRSVGDSTLASKTDTSNDQLHQGEPLPQDWVEISKYLQDRLMLKCSPVQSSSSRTETMFPGVEWANKKTELCIMTSARGMARLNVDGRRIGNRFFSELLCRRKMKDPT
ncbi:hypothetical protein A3K70_00435 [Candidatus Bathyarchaeota archaeon RBG_16_48_13]|nr:MAG: hypothetical protein A3K70_00435 [Candidatus Bathyarchaeota archaeon RBG_16_48_13]